MHSAQFQIDRNQHREIKQRRRDDADREAAKPELLTKRRVFMNANAERRQYASSTKEVYE